MPGFSEIRVLAENSYCSQQESGLKNCITKEFDLFCSRWPCFGFMLRYFSFLFFALFIARAPLSAQSGNACEVKAILSPANNDTTIYGSNVIYFSSASLNATEHELNINGYTFTNTATTGWVIEPGLSIVRLIARNGNCADTVIIHIFCVGTFPSSNDNPRRVFGTPQSSQEIKSFVKLNSGGYLLSGDRTYFAGDFRPRGLVIKTNENGCIEWGRIFHGGPDVHVTHATESEDGAIYVASRFFEISSVLHKLDQQGQRIWSKVLTNSDGNQFIIKGIVSMPDGGIVIMLHTWYTVHRTLVRLDSNGEIVWQKTLDFQAEAFGRTEDLLYKDGAIYLSGEIIIEPNPFHYSFLAKFNSETGDKIWMKNYERPNGTVNLNNMIDADSIIVMAIQGPTGVTNMASIGGYMAVDSSGEVKHALMLAREHTPNPLVAPYNTHKTSIVKSGNSFYIQSFGTHQLSLQPLISHASTIARLDSTFRPRWVESTSGVGAIIFSHSAQAVNSGIAIAGNENAPGILGDRRSVIFSYKVIDTAGSNPAGYCYRPGDELLAFPQTFSYTPDNAMRTIPGDFQVSNSNVPIDPLYPETRILCPSYVDSCSYLKITGPLEICNLSNTYTYRTHKNKACGQPTIWQSPDGAELVNKTDTTLTLRFTRFGRFVIYGNNPMSCSPVKDSIVVDAVSKTPPLDLGEDKELCPQNSLMLRAGPSYLQYRWQDGSADSNFVVQQPGEYWVEVSDSCGNILKDTIIIDAAPPVPLSIGPDRFKCNNDTLRIEAPAGFMNYTWGPDYNIIEDATTSIIVNPSVDTSYTLMVEASAGCFGYDTIHVKVSHSPSINLGPDTSICQGDSVVFDAGPGFESYSWNSSPGAQQFSTRNAGIYTLEATTSLGCRSTDTVVVNQVFPLPVVQFTNDPVLCEGETAILTPGSSFMSYTWNNGTHGNFLEVSSPGTYSVEVMDANGCKGYGTTTIERIQPLPTGFLPADTQICSYGSIQLQPTKNFENYSWSNGSIARELTVTAPGIYWLDVTDNQNCIGRDSVLVSLKQCLEGFFVPTAFTPNGDGLNDEFRPLIFGDIVRYKFVVFNRWGQIVFSSEDPAKGWNGRMNGIFQNSDVYVWTCHFQLLDMPARTERGTVSLIR
jgi:gliding motility-associated-like protein